jgi:hypothetical protein
MVEINNSEEPVKYGRTTLKGKKRYKWQYCAGCQRESRFETYPGRLFWVCRECGYQKKKSFIPNAGIDRSSQVKIMTVGLYHRQFEILERLKELGIIKNRSEVIRTAMDLYFSTFSTMLDHDTKINEIYKKVDHNKFVLIDGKIREVLKVLK